MKKLLTTVTVLAGSFAPMLSLAIQDNAPFKLKGNTLSGGGTDIVNLLSALINWIFTILLILAVIFILIAAFNYLTSGGNSEKVTKANKMLIYALVAVAVAFLAKGLIFVVQQLVAPGQTINNAPPFNN